MEKFSCVVVHYGDIGLKGKNRPYFERFLKGNIERALSGLKYDYVRRIPGRIIIGLSGKSDAGAVENKIRKVFGITGFSFAFECERNVEEISDFVWGKIRKKKFKSFRIGARRADKSFRHTSQQVNEMVGAYIKKKSKAEVNLTKPKLTIHIEITDKSAYIYFDRIKGPGGLPVGSSGRAVALISSGIDSPLAAYKAMKRGLRIIFVHFHSYPYTNRKSIDKTIRLVGMLNECQYDSKLYLVPFIEIQNEIVSKCDPKLRVILYRRMMVRIAEEIAGKEGAKALVTGESVGQVASQTLDNIFVINKVCGMPVLRPLIGDDKEEIIREAQALGTYAISIQPHDDCCSLFLPKRPETHARLDAVEHAEGKLDVRGLVKMAADKAEMKRI